MKNMYLMNDKDQMASKTKKHSSSPLRGKKYIFQNFTVTVCHDGMKSITLSELSLIHYPNQNFNFLASEHRVE